MKCHAISNSQIFSFMDTLQGHSRTLSILSIFKHSKLKKLSRAKTTRPKIVAKHGVSSQIPDSM